MIIRSIKAENFMKFARLSLTGLPDNGVIGILGPNESGKSTIGEAILFAFFGQSRMSKSSPLESLIHWGSEYMRIEIDFILGIELGKKRLLRVYREIDRFGTNYAKIMELPGKGEVARGNREVTAFIQNHIGFDLFEFHHAFYHDQYGSRQVDNSQREFLERLTGVRQMENATERIGTEIEQLEREFAHYQKDIGRNLKQIERFSRTSERIPELREEEEKSVCDYVRVKDAVELAVQTNDVYRGLQGGGNGGGRGFKDLASARGSQLEDGVNGLLEDYKALQLRCLEGDLEDSALASETGKIRQALERTNEFLDAYKDLRRNCIDAREVLESELYGSGESTLKTRLGTLEQQKAGLAASLSGGFKVLVVAAVFFFIFAAAVAVLVIKPELMKSFSESFDPRYVQFGCGGLGFLALLFMIMKYVGYRGIQSHTRGLTKNISRLKKQIQATKSKIRDYLRLEELKNSGAPRDYVDAAKDFVTGLAAKRLEEFRGRFSSMLGLDPSDESGDYTDLILEQVDNEKACRRRINELSQLSSKRLKESEATLKKAQSSRDRISNELREAEGQLAKKETLDEKVAEYENAAMQIRGEIDDRRAACDLLKLCSATTREKVGPTLSSYLKCILPRLTDGRYRDVKLTPDLEILVFASDRSDFIPAAELSGGTNEALMLGLRLGLAQAHITSHTSQKQFMFLDEPFKMMDGPRVVGALESLSQLSEELRQFFVIQPQCGQEQVDALDQVIRTEVELTELEIDFGA